jgi:hypothetical protein
LPKSLKALVDAVGECQKGGGRGPAGGDLAGEDALEMRARARTCRRHAAESQMPAVFV